MSKSSHAEAPGKGKEGEDFSPPKKALKRLWAFFHEDKNLARKESAGAMGKMLGEIKELFDRGELPHEEILVEAADFVKRYLAEKAVTSEKLSDEQWSELCQETRKILSGFTHRPNEAAVNAGFETKDIHTLPAQAKQVEEVLFSHQNTCAFRYTKDIHTPDQLRQLLSQLTNSISAQEKAYQYIMRVLSRVDVQRTGTGAEDWDLGDHLERLRNTYIEATNLTYAYRWYYKDRAAHYMSDDPALHLHVAGDAYCKTKEQLLDKIKTLEDNLLPIESIIKILRKISRRNIYHAFPEFAPPLPAPDDPDLDAALQEAEAGMGLFYAFMNNIKKALGVENLKAFPSKSPIRL